VEREELMGLGKTGEAGDAKTEEEAESGVLGTGEDDREEKDET
jgi:hypothetical protein